MYYYHYKAPVQQEIDPGMQARPLSLVHFHLDKKSGVYILPFISIFILIKNAIFSRFYKKKWVHFIKNQM